MIATLSRLLLRPSSESGGDGLVHTRLLMLQAARSALSRKRNTPCVCVGTQLDWRWVPPTAPRHHKQHELNAASRSARQHRSWEELGADPAGVYCCTAALLHGAPFLLCRVVKFAVCACTRVVRPCVRVSVWQAVDVTCSQSLPRGARHIPQMVDYQAVYDVVTSTVVVQSCFSPSAPFAHSCGGCGETRWVQTMSRDHGRTFTAPAIVTGPALGTQQGVQPGAGRALQLHAAAKGKAGRLLFCGHTIDSTHGNISPVWVSDDHGLTYRLTATLPRGLPGAPKWGPDECSLVELGNGDMRMDARNNFATETGHPTRMHFTSTDGGDARV